MSIRISLIVALAIVATALTQADQASGYDQLVTLFHDFVAAERPPLTDGAPDYTPPATSR